MYCPKCGKKLKEGQKVCSRCQFKIGTKIIEEETKKNGKFILCIVLNVISLLYTVSVFSSINNLSETLKGKETEYVLGYAIGMILIQVVLSTFAFFMSRTQIKNKDKKAYVNIVLSSLSYLVNIVIFILVLVKYL